MLMRQYVRQTLLIHVLTILPFAFGRYKIGVGIADCTGPAAEIVFMGYAKSSQKGCGIHLRQFSRAFIVDDDVKRAAFVSVDAAMMAHGVVEAVLNRLSKVYNNTYTESNLVLSGTHTHGTPGGFLMDFMYDIPSYGFVKDTFEALVCGITKSIMRAHENMVDGRIYLSSGELLGANINRSPTSYLLNPEEERAKYKYDVDKEMVQLKFLKSSDNSLIGAVNWFAVHPTSMNNTNCLITSDNVGYASLLLEKSINNNMPVGKVRDEVISQTQSHIINHTANFVSHHSRRLSAATTNKLFYEKSSAQKSTHKTPFFQGPFVGAFASSNLGDVSPNTNGPRCVTTGEKCDSMTSTCDGHAKYCIASGPGRDMFESTKIIAEKLFDKAKMLLEKSSSKEMRGPINYIHRFVDMPEESATITLSNGTVEQVHGCLPAMGYSFAAGTTDGPGEFDFAQGTRSTNTYWNTIRDFIFKPTAEDIACQYPKPILINTGRVD
ncbi:neutral ceramidase [Asbolus verrucosus]|uniref:Neutral ceramidase n=1 Tax=Asbolus verrucosus TaxID=1661398 RepID=A0A482VGV6_ASBVE|nr:neutral ceramidase [Asbolus verrucosus]